MDLQQQQEAITELKTLRDILRYGASRFNEAGVYFGHGTDNAWDEAVQLALHSLHLSITFGDKVLDSHLTVSERQQIINLYRERILKRIPAAYLTNTAWFAGLEFYVDPRVLIPRSPIAELIEQQFAPWVDLEAKNECRILDMGTGSGCIAIACAYYIPNAIIDGVDISTAALEVAKINCHKHKVNEQVNLIHSDLFLQLKNQKYDIIIANPPYVDALDIENLPQEYLHEPMNALAAGQDGLDIVNKILQQAYNYLTDEGVLIVEVGNSARALETHYPQLPVQWLEFERGGSGVFLIYKEQLNVRK